MDEWELYEQIKRAFTVDKGKALLIEVTSSKVSELAPQLLDSERDLVQKVWLYTKQKRCHVFFDYLAREKPIFVFNGLTYGKAEVIENGEILDFIAYSQKTITAEDIRRDFKMLNLILENKKPA